MFISVSKQGRYAKVLLDFCDNEIQAIEMYETLRILKSVLVKRYKRLPRFLNTEILESVLGSIVFKNAGDDHLPILRKFILFINHAKRLELLDKIIFALQQLMVEKYNSVVANVDVSPYMSKEQLSSIKQFVSSRLKKRVTYKVSIDPSKLMGFSMRIMHNLEIHANFAHFIKRIKNENCQ